MVDQSALRRRRTVVLATAAAAVVAGGAFVTTQMHETKPKSQSEPPPTTAAVAPNATESMAHADSVPTPITTTSSAVPTSHAATSHAAETPSPTAKTSAQIEEEIKKARAKAAADGYPLQRPVDAKENTSAVTQWTQPIKNGTVRITTARRDLTGDASLAVAGDPGKPVGSGVKCTDKVRFTQDAPAVEHPTLLMCWRTSSTRSVITMMAIPTGKPSAGASVALIDEQWAKLH